MISPHFPPEFGWHGPGRDSMELAMEVARRGHDVDVIACSEKIGEGETRQDGLRVIRVNWQKDGRKNSLVAHSLPQSRLLMNMNLAVWQAFLEASRSNRYDVVDVSGYSAESLVPSILADCPVISRQHDRAPAFLDRELAIIGSSGFKFEKHLADSLKSVSALCSNAIATMGEGKPSDMDEVESIACTNYSLDSDTFSPEGPLAIDTEGRPALLIHTAIKNEKYVVLLSEIISRVKKDIPELWVTIVANDIDSESSESVLKKSLRQRGILFDLVVNQKMARLLMPGLWRNSTCGLVMDWQKLAPYAVLEPLSCAVPLVVEWQSVDLSFLKDQTLISKPAQFTAELVAENLVALLKDEKLRKDLGEKSRQYILSDHCRKANGEKTIKTYQTVIERFKTTQHEKKIQAMEKVLRQCRSLSDWLDEWLYDLLFVRSLRFRLSHWLKKFK